MVFFHFRDVLKSRQRLQQPERAFRITKREQRMNIRLGIYDIFSRIVPGGFYMAAFIQFAVVMGWVVFDWAGLQSVELLPSLALAFAAYVVGAAMDRIASHWHLLFKKRGMSNRVLQQFKDKHAGRWTFD